MQTVNRIGMAFAHCIIINTHVSFWEAKLDGSMKYMILGKK